MKGKMVDNIENKKYFVEVFLNFRNVFESIRHKIYPDKHRLHGTRGVVTDSLRGTDLTMP